jgi:hypothetical protein
MQFASHARREANLHPPGESTQIRCVWTVEETKFWASTCSTVRYVNQKKKESYAG